MTLAALTVSAITSGSVGQLQRPVLLGAAPCAVLLGVLVDGILEDADPEDPADEVDAGGPQAPPEIGRLLEVAVEQERADADADGEEGEHEGHVHHFSQQRVVAACFLQEPAKLEEGVGDLRATDGGHHLRAVLADQQRPAKPYNAEGVVQQHG